MCCGGDIPPSNRAQPPSPGQSGSHPRWRRGTEPKQLGLFVYILHGTAEIIVSVLSWCRGRVTCHVSAVSKLSGACLRHPDGPEAEEEAGGAGGGAGGGGRGQEQGE